MYKDSPVVLVYLLSSIGGAEINEKAGWQNKTANLLLTALIPECCKIDLNAFYSVNLKAYA